MKPGSKKWKNFMAKLYGIGASVVIVGALFKIQHWPFASLLLIVGLTTEAIIFFFSAFEPIHEEPDWSLVYPELATGEHGEGGQDKIGAGTITEQLDGMLAEAKIEPELLQSLGDGMRTLSSQASQLNDISDATVATQEYSDSLKGASEKINELAETYAHTSESLTGLKDSQAIGASAGEHLANMNNNLSALNNMYEMQLSEMEKSRAMYSDMTELMTNLSESVADTKAYKENISELAKNLESLNRLYSNMLNAMNTGGQS